MNVEWNDVFQLPNAALAGNTRIPETKLIEQADLTKHEQKALGKMRRLEHFASVQKATTRILPRIDRERDIQSIIFLRCEMADNSLAVAEIAHLLHKCFKNPTVVMQEAGAQICLSVSLTRKSLAEQGAIVVDRIESTGLFRYNAAEWQPLLEEFAFERLPQEDLFVYAQAMAEKVMLSRAINALGFYPHAQPESHERILALAKQHESLRVEMNRLCEERKGRDVTLNESAKLRMRIREIEKQRDVVLSEIKEFCDD